MPIVYRQPPGLDDGRHGLLAAVLASLLGLATTSGPQRAALPVAVGREVVVPDVVVVADVVVQLRDVNHIDCGSQVSLSSHVVVVADLSSQNVAEPSGDDVVVVVDVVRLADSLDLDADGFFDLGDVWWALPVAQAAVDVPVDQATEQAGLEVLPATDEEPC